MVATGHEEFGPDRIAALASEIKAFTVASPKRMPTVLYSAAAGLTPQAIIEVVVYRWRRGRLEVLLLPRPSGDPDWPGQVHTPGTALRNADFVDCNGDSPFASALRRLETEELGTALRNCRTVRGSYYAQSKRSAEVKRIVAAQIDRRANLRPDMYWFPVDDLAKHVLFIQEQLGFVQIVAAYIKSRRLLLRRLLHGLTRRWYRTIYSGRPS